MLQSPNSIITHGSQILEHIFVVHTDHPPALRFQRSSALCVIGNLPALAVGCAIDFDDQHAGSTGEVGDVDADGPLPDEFMTAEAATAQVFPQPDFGGGFGAAQVAGVLEDAGDVADHGGKTGWRGNSVAGVRNYFRVGVLPLIRPSGTFSRRRGGRRRLYWPSPDPSSGKGARRADEGKLLRTIEI